MSDEYDVAIVGAGPAGVNAALETCRAGLRTLVVDEQPAAGGQVWRRHSAAILDAPETPESAAGERLRAQLRASGADHLAATRLWQIETDGACWHLALTGPAGPRRIRGRRLVLATGAQERVLPVPGWTLPGVIGLAGATALFKRDLALPGDDTVIAGCGPLVFFVAAEILRLGGRPRAVAVLNSRRDWLRAAPALGAHAGLLARGMGWAARLAARGVPIHWSHALARVDGDAGVESVELVPVDRAWAPVPGARPVRVGADSVCVGHGLMPAVEAAAMAGASLGFDSALGGWTPVLGPDGKADVERLWICGDGAGVLGAPAAALRGSLAGLAVAADLGRGGEASRARHATLERRLARAARLGEAMGRLMRLRAGLVALIERDTVVCRCEGVTRGDIEAELASGAASPDALKRGRRAGMGPCGGRFCNETLAILLANATGRSRGEIGRPSVRPPLHPVAIGDIVADIDYDALPIPAPAPL